jgi:hypothetical protein
MKNTASRTNEGFLDRKNYKLRRPPGCRLNCNLGNALKHHYVCYLIRYCRKWGWRHFWLDNFTRPVDDERGQVFGPEAFKWKFDPETFRMCDGRTLKEWESENRYRLTRREQLIQEELKKLMLVPSGRTQQEQARLLEKEIKWHPHGQDSSKPFAPKPPLTMTTLRMMALIRVVEKLFSVPKRPNG